LRGLSTFWVKTLKEKGIDLGYMREDASSERRKEEKIS